MIFVLGEDVAVTKAKQCTRSLTDHVKLRDEARLARKEKKLNIEESYVLCLGCGELVPLQCMGSSG
jgi:RNA polymerase-binding transcription factor DksA